MSISDRLLNNVILYNENGTPARIDDTLQALSVTQAGGYKNTYSAAIANVAMATSPTDVFTLIGSASKLVRVLRVGFSALQTTAAGRDVLLIKRSTANSGGTSTTPTVVSYDSTQISGTAVARSYTANPASLGTAVGTIFARKTLVGALTGAADSLIIEFGNNCGKHVILRGVAETLAINLNSVSSSGGVFSIFIEWTEE